MNFKIYKNFANTKTFIIKETGNIDPITIDASDTFEVSLVKLDDLVDSGITINVTPEVGLNGKVVVEIPDASSLVSERGSKADRYYSKPTYKMILTGTTVAAGEVLLVIPEVHIV